MKTHLSPRVLAISASLLIVQLLTSAEAADALDSWAMRYVAPFTLRSVTYGADPDIFVALGDAVYSSKDGMCWTKRPLDPPLYEGRGGLAYGNGTFVAVGEGAAYVSKEGTSWQHSASVPDGLQQVTFGGGSFLAVGQEYHPRPQSGTHWLIATSTDGFTWTRQSGPTNENEQYYLGAAAYGNGRFVVGGWTLTPGAPPLMMTSTNLTDWELVDFPFAVVRGITYGNGQFVAVGTSVATSVDGINWIDQQTVTVPGLEAVTFGQDTFVATGIDGRIWSSPDAQLWTPAETGVDGLSAVTYGNGSFIAVGGFYTNLPRGVATQSGGQPQLCLQALGFESGLSPGFHLSATVEGGRTYQLQSAPELPADSWTEVSRVSIPRATWPETRRFVDSAASKVDQKFYRLTTTP